jgi:hypothetical protein
MKAASNIADGSSQLGFPGVPINTRPDCPRFGQ